MRALNGLCKELAIQALNVFVQNPTTYSAEKGFSVLVDIKTKKRSCLLNETLDDLMRGGGGGGGGLWSKKLSLTDLILFPEICSSKRVISSLPLDMNKTLKKFCCYLNIFFSFLK